MKTRKTSRPAGAASSSKDRGKIKRSQGRKHAVISKSRSKEAKGRPVKSKSSIAKKAKVPRINSTKKKQMGTRPQKSRRKVRSKQPENGHSNEGNNSAELAAPAAVRTRRKKNGDADGTLGKKPSMNVGRKRSRQQAESSDISSDTSTEDDSEHNKGSGSRVPSGQATGTMKRSRSLWRMRPLMLDEKLRIFVEGRDEELLHYDGGEFFEWLKECESEGLQSVESDIYPLIVQDSEFRNIVEIKEPSRKLATAMAWQNRQGHPSVPVFSNKSSVSDSEAVSRASIRVPTFRMLPESHWPDDLLAKADSKVRLVYRAPGGGAVSAYVGSESSHSISTDSASMEYFNVPSLPGWPKGEASLAKDPPFIRYIQPTPDELDLSVEYDLDEDDEAWLEKFNREASKRLKGSKTTRRKNALEGEYVPGGGLGEEWLEHLIDRLEKEYTAELQRHPEKWLVGSNGSNKSHDQEHQQKSRSMVKDRVSLYTTQNEGVERMERPQSSLAMDNGSRPVPIITVPPIEEVLPFEKCIELPALREFEDEATLRAVYDYWRTKHNQVGRPLIQRLWYEPPWHRGKATSRAKAAATSSLLRKSSSSVAYEGPTGTASRQMPGTIRMNANMHAPAIQEGEGVFVASDYSAPTLQGIRKRRMETSEVTIRFEAIRRDLEGVRTLTDRIRRREKLKRREMALLAEEWQSRLKDIATGRNDAALRLKSSKELKHPPPETHALTALRLASAAQASALAAATAVLGFDPFDTGEVMPTVAVDRAARLAARRDARDAAIAKAEGSLRDRNRGKATSKVAEKKRAKGDASKRMNEHSTSDEDQRARVGRKGAGHRGPVMTSQRRGREISNGSDSRSRRKKARSSSKGMNGIPSEEDEESSYVSDDEIDDRSSGLMLEASDDDREKRNRTSRPKNAVNGRKTTSGKAFSTVGYRSEHGKGNRKSKASRKPSKEDEDALMSAALKARATVHSNSIREQARAQAAVQPRSASGRFLPFMSRQQGKKRHDSPSRKGKERVQGGASRLRRAMEDTTSSEGSLWEEEEEDDEAHPSSVDSDITEEESDSAGTPAAGRVLKQDALKGKENRYPSRQSARGQSKGVARVNKTTDRDDVKRMKRENGISGGSQERSDAPMRRGRGGAQMAGKSKKFPRELAALFD